MAAEKKTQAAADPAAPAVLRVSSFAPQFYRCGRRFTPDPVEIPLAELGEEELARLEAERQLKTERV